MKCYVLGLAVHPPHLNCQEFRLEEMVYHTARAALDNAGVTRGQLDHVTLGACDELDGRSISSMLMAMPAGGYLVDEIKVTDSGASALCLEMARIKSEEFDIGLVSSWCKSSKTDVESVMRLRGEPFYTRPLGINMAVSDALFAQTVEVKDAWVRNTVQGQKGTGAFMKITAKDGAKLISISSPVAGVAEVHEMKMDGDIMRMRAAPALDLPAGKKVDLKSGGYHIMLMDLKTPLAKDSSVPMTLLFRDTKGVESKLELKVPVSTTAPGGKEPAAAQHKH